MNPPIYILSDEPLMEEPAQVTPEETALLVLTYLQREWPRSAAAYREEASALLSRLPQPEGDVKPLDAVLSEYVQLEAAARKRARFEGSFGESIAARSVLSKIGRLLDDYLSFRQQQRRTTVEALAEAEGVHEAPCPPNPAEGAGAAESGGVSTAARKRKGRMPNRHRAGASLGPRRPASHHRLSSTSECVGYAPLQYP